MTSTPFNVGLGDGNRLSSRVLRPPGGGHTDIFGGEAEPPRGRRAAPPPVSQIGEPLKPTNGTNANNAPSQNGQEAPSQEQHIPEPAQESKESPKAEPTKDEPTKVEAPKAEPPKVDAPKRVRVPPGGFSSGLW